MSASIRKIDVAGLKISAITKPELIAQISERVSARQKTFVTTPYSEFLYASMRRPDIRAMLNSADFAIADGIGVMWAHLFLSVPLTTPGFYLKIIQAWWQVVWTGASILLNPKLIRKDIPEKIVGADLIWDLAKLAAEKNFSIYLLGGWGNTTEIVAEKLQAKYPNLKIAGKSTKNQNDLSIVDDINSANPDMVFVALGALTQEQWIADNLNKISATFAIGLGGTFDYVAGTKQQPPKFIRRVGLEWLYRLITQPSRIGRIYRGVVGLIIALIRFKVYATTPYRKNVVVVVVNTEGKILICKHMPWSPRYSDRAQPKEDYWEFPQGGVEIKENILEAAKRELYEETGLTSVVSIGQSKSAFSYVWDNATRPLFVKDRWINKGQEQTAVFFKFTGNDNEVVLDNREFDEYKWVEPEQVLKTIAKVRRPHTEIVLAELAQIQV